ncbi:MAG: leucine-rich repeat protein, partial [Tissierellia bacterium]|nr:leucine-rich repeat protein [Tissierellia bacterium]
MNNLKRKMALLLALLMTMGTMVSFQTIKAFAVAPSPETEWTEGDFIYSSPGHIIAFSDQGIEKQKVNKNLKFPEGTISVRGNYTLTHQDDPIAEQREFGRPNKTYESVTFPDSVTDIGYATFYMAKIEKLNLPKGLKRIGGVAFFPCGLKEVKLPEGLESIGHNAFEKNELTEITIPSSVQKIDKYAFVSNELYKIVIKGTPIVEKYAFAKQKAVYEPKLNPFYKEHFGYKGKIGFDKMPEGLMDKGEEYTFKDDSIEKVTSAFHVPEINYNGTISIVNPHRWSEGTQTDTTSQDIKDLEAKIEELQKDKEEKEKTISELEEQLENCKDNGAKLKAEKEALEKEILTKDETIEKLKKKVEALQKSDKEKAEEIKILQEKIDSLTKEQEQLKKELNEKNLKIQELEKELANQKKIIEQLEQTVKEKNERIKTLEDEMKALQEKIAQLDAEAIENQAELEQLRDKVKVLGKEKEKLQGEVESLAWELEAERGKTKELEDKINQLTTQIETCKAKQEELKRDIAEKEKLIQSLEKANSEKVQIIEELEQKIADATKEKEDCCEKISEIEKMLKELKESSSKLKEELEDRIANLEKEITEQNNEIEELKKALEEQKEKTDKDNKEKDDNKPGNQPEKDKIEALKEKLEKLIEEAKHKRNPSKDLEQAITNGLDTLFDPYSKKRDYEYAIKDLEDALQKEKDQKYNKSKLTVNEVKSGDQNVTGTTQSRWYIDIEKNGKGIGQGQADYRGSFDVALKEKVSAKDTLVVIATDPSNHKNHVKVEVEVTGKKQNENTVNGMKDFSVFMIGKDYYNVIANGKKTTVYMDVKAFIQNDRTMLPVRYVAYTL